MYFSTIRQVCTSAHFMRFKAHFSEDLIGHKSLSIGLINSLFLFFTKGCMFMACTTV